MSLKDRKRCDELLSRLGIECVKNKIQRARPVAPNGGLGRSPKISKII